MPEKQQEENQSEKRAGRLEGSRNKQFEEEVDEIFDRTRGDEDDED